MWVLLDMDGTLTGTEPNAKIVASSSIYDSDLCEEHGYYKGSVHGSVCGPLAHFTRLAFNKIEPNDSLMGAELLVETSHGNGMVPFHYQVNKQTEETE